MKILFLGQRGIPFLRSSSVERRVEALATSLAASGHEVMVTCAPPLVSKNINRFNGVELVHLVSLDPTKPGGWVHTALELYTLWREQPAVVHMHGWKLALLAPLLVLLSPETNYVWTVDEMGSKYPKWVYKVVARNAGRMFDLVTVPWRELQYRILVEWQMRLVYIPDGYDEPVLAPLAVKNFGLRAGQQYALILGGETSEIRQAVLAIKKSGWRKKIVAMAPTGSGSLSRLTRKFKQLHLVEADSKRARQSLIAQALIVVMNKEVDQSQVLAAMDSGKMIVAVNTPRLAEVLGTTARFVDGRKTDDMVEAIRALNSKNGAAARRRAQAHFKWSRILPEYLELYHYPLVETVMLDSARQVTPSPA